MLSQVLAVPLAANVRLDAPRTRTGSEVGWLEAVRLTLPEKEVRLARVNWTSPELVIGIVIEDGDTVMEKSGEGPAAETADNCMARTRANVMDARTRFVIRDDKSASSSVNPVPRELKSSGQ
jgi:hypothetical protein